MSQTSDESASSTSSPTEEVLSTWEDDENRATMGLRSFFAVLCGLYLLWAQSHSHIRSGQEWSHWIWLSVVCNLILPLGVVWLFFGQGVIRLDWLKDQKHNAWNYGVNFKDWRRHLRISALLFIALLPFLFYFSRQSDIRSYYGSYFPASDGLMPFMLLLLSLAVYMFCWEWFFRGFLLFGAAQGFTPWVAIPLQAVIFGFAHAGKPPVEMFSSFAGGLVLGVICWREKSFAPAFYTHALIHVAWAILVTRF